MSTMENLKAAFAGESQANRKYLAFADQARKDGFPEVAKLFRAVAAAETVHAHAHLRTMGGVKSTLENLEEAMAGEAHEFREMYPGFIAEAGTEGNRRAEISFRNASTVEETHHGLYDRAIAAVKGGQDLPGTRWHVCEICGHTHAGEAPGRCPVCGAPAAKFAEVA